MARSTESSVTPATPVGRMRALSRAMVTLLRATWCGSGAAALACLMLAGATPAAAEEPDKVSVGLSSVLTDAALYIAKGKGFFGEQKLDVELIGFDSSPKLIPPLGTGQIDVAAGASTASLYNAALRNVSMKIVADKGSTPAHYDYMPLMVSKALIDSGRFKSYADLKGLKVAEAGKGTSTGSTLNEALKRGGLSYNDVEHLFIPYPSQIAAYANKSIEASITTEPTAIRLIEAGLAVRYPREEYYPDQQVAILIYGGDFIEKRRDVAQRFMTAYIKATRFYNDALKDGRFAGPTAKEVIDILSRETPVKDRALYAKMVPAGINPDGKLNEASLRKDIEFFKSQGFFTEDVDLGKLVDRRFVEDALKTLGPYQPRR